MRLQRGVLVGGVDPETARDIARACHDDWRSAEQIGYRLTQSPSEVTSMLNGLTQAGFLEVSAERPGQDDPMWRTTLSGGALTMASLLKPMSRAQADRLLEGVLQRAAAYNADASKPWIIQTVSVFGSYVRPNVEELGELDLAVHTRQRWPGSADAEALIAYAQDSGRRFPNFVASLGWAQTELLQLLRNRSGYINVHTEDVSVFTADGHVVYDFSSAPSTP